MSNAKKHIQDILSSYGDGSCVGYQATNLFIPTPEGILKLYGAYAVFAIAGGDYVRAWASSYKELLAVIKRYQDAGMLFPEMTFAEKPCERVVLELFERHAHMHCKGLVKVSCHEN